MAKDTPSGGVGIADNGGEAAARQRPRRLRAMPAWVREVARQTPAWLASMVLHMVVLIMLAVFSLPPTATETLRQLVVSPDEVTEELDELVDEPLEEIHLDAVASDVIAVEKAVSAEDTRVSPVEDVSAAGVAVELDDLGFEKAPRNDLLATVGAYSGDALSGRSEGARQGLVNKYGGSKGSEAAVASALAWLAAHQMSDGGWMFAHQLAPKCHGQCRDPGLLKEARNAATGLALLPFLGAGQTHKKGEYQQVVQAGLHFLTNRMDRKTGSLHEPEGYMYSHGIAAITLCEAFAMTHDKTLLEPSQRALNFICLAQDPVGGGWRYEPRMPGDTSVVGWQIMALKSGHMAYLQIPPLVVKKASIFLDSVQADSGAAYGYTSPGAGKATTAVGLLCRMYLGWKKEEPALERGVKLLGEQGPQSDMYYNYYATQVMRHWEGEAWNKWNTAMRDQLVNAQAKVGHESGSWFMAGDPHGRHGGRLYCTSMATMVLEVYYRHLPIYAKKSTEEKFPVE